MTMEQQASEGLHGFWREAIALPFIGEADHLLEPLDEARDKLLAKDAGLATSLSGLDTALSHDNTRQLLLASLETSSYLRDLMAKDLLRLSDILSDHPADRIKRLAECAINESKSTDAEIMRHLRLIKQDAALTIGLADLAGLWTVRQVTNALTEIADATLRAALRYVLSETHRRGKIVLPFPEDPERDCGYFALAMGKHGAGELNYSSDIDLHHHL